MREMAPWLGYLENTELTLNMFWDLHANEAVNLPGRVSMLFSITQTGLLPSLPVRDDELAGFVIREPETSSTI